MGRLRKINDSVTQGDASSTGNWNHGIYIFLVNRNLRE